MYRIGIDARLTFYSQAGISQYTQHLVGQLARLDPESSYLLLQSRKDRRNLASAANQRRVACWTPAHHRFERRALGIETLPLRLDLLHSPDFIPPHSKHFRSVITVHDLAFLRYPEFMTVASRRYYNDQIEAATRRADHIIAVSEATRADLLELLAVPAGKISVIYEAADERFRPLSGEEVSAQLKAYDLTPGYALFVGTFEPRKNIDGLLRAYAILRSDLPDAPRLVMVGKRGWLDDDLLPLVAELGLEEHVRWLESVPYSQLQAIYNGAGVLCMPSYYEGFGLPVLEAMACGKPVIVANRSSLPEVVGDAGVLVNPDDTTEIAAAMQRVLSDNDYAESLSRAGLARAATFSWEKAARETLAVYRQVLT